jgi:hypothetical protein
MNYPSSDIALRGFIFHLSLRSAPFLKLYRLVIISCPVLVLAMTSPTYSTELFEKQLVQVLTTTYNSGIKSKRYLDAKTGLPFHIEWINPNKQGK